MSKKQPEQRSTRHKCELLRGSNSCLPKLHPEAGILRRAFRNLRKLAIISRVNPKCQQFFRSEFTVNAEKQRHIRSKGWYVIHPFSRFCMIREMVVAITWIYVFFKDPFTICFFPVHKRVSSTLHYFVETLSDIILAVYALSSFFTGYHIFKTKEIVLQPDKIAFHYVRTYFLFDVFGTIPLNYILIDIFGIQEQVLLTFTGFTRLLRFVRLKTMLNYLKHITARFGMREVKQDIMNLVLTTFYLLHWMSCLIYVVPKIRYKMYGSLPRTTWLYQAHMCPFSGVNRLIKWVRALLMVTCHFYMAGTGLYTLEEAEEQLVAILISMFGVIFFGYVVIVVLEITASSNASETKYEEIMYQLHEYMVTKKLSASLRNRLIIYYENKFQKHYFRESSILSTLSEHLRHEIFLHSTKILVEKVELLRGLPKSVSADLVGRLKQEVFLCNDVVYASGTLGVCMYFIVSGAVGSFLPSGKEVDHICDGDHFGETCVNEQNRRVCSLIAVEFTECLRLDRKDLIELKDAHPDFAKRLERRAQERRQKVLMAAAMDDDANDTVFGKHDVLYELRKGKIVSPGLRREIAKLK